MSLIWIYCLWSQTSLCWQEGVSVWSLRQTAVVFLPETQLVSRRWRSFGPDDGSGVEGFQNSRGWEARVHIGSISAMFLLVEWLTCLPTSLFLCLLKADKKNRVTALHRSLTYWRKRLFYFYFLALCPSLMLWLTWLKNVFADQSDFDTYF